MSFNTFGRVFRFSTWGESHGPALGALVDGCPPGLALSEADIQPFLDQRRPGTSRFTTQRQEPDAVRSKMWISGRRIIPTSPRPIVLAMLITVMTPNTAFAIIAAVAGRVRVRLRRGLRRVQWHGQ